MVSVLNEIMKLRNGAPITIDYHNSNRYQVVIQEMNGTKTAYCFGVPVYNRQSRKLISLKFYENGGVWNVCGSDTHITMVNEILMENENSFCKICLPEGRAYIAGKEARYGNTKIFPTLNGILVKVPCTANQIYETKLLSGQPFMEIRANDRCFSLMREGFKPFVTVSCIGVLGGSGRIIAPCGLEYQKNSDTEYTLALHHTSPYGTALLFEINLHEEKLFQDTTVESLHPEVNNAFGGTAFVGHTAAYGEQWLYARPDFSKLPELYDKQIRKAVLHLPQYGGSEALTAFGLSTRFCSFGSNWKNKVQETKAVVKSTLSNGYQSLDITGMITDSTHFLKPSEGFILKPKGKGSGFCAVSTGDSYFAPQILEMNFR